MGICISCGANVTDDEMQGDTCAACAAVPENGYTEEDEDSDEKNNSEDDNGDEG